jgi:uncharacterized CHY-type Zn-finger protein
MTLCHQKVYGLQLNEQTGCLHYASPLDIVAIKFKCCNKYYACYDCHAALADHLPERWGRDDFQTKAILCGRCGEEMSIEKYRSCNSRCPHCKALFNPKCELHWNLYFCE